MDLGVTLLGGLRGRVGFHKRISRTNLLNRHGSNAKNIKVGDQHLLLEDTGIY